MSKTTERGDIAIILGGVLLLLAAIVTVVYPFTGEEVEFIPIEKEIAISDNSRKYFVFTDETEYAIKDKWVILQFDATEEYRNIKIGQTCTATAYWYRVNIFSWYKNLDDIRCT